MSDTKALANEAPRSPVELSPMRAAIARRMTQSKQQAPHFYVESEVAMDAVLDALDRLNAASASSPGGARVTATGFLARACAAALRSHPRLNSVWTERGTEQVERVNLGVAVALEGGLVAPALLGADSMTLVQTAAALRDLVARARAGKLRSAEVSEATFTLSNLGMFEVTRFTAIIVPPQVAILATGRIAQRQVVVDGEVVTQSLMNATVSADHRVVDGAEVAAFLGTFKSLLETPEQLDG